MKNSQFKKTKSNETYECEVFDANEVKHSARIDFKDGEFFSAIGFPFASQFSRDKAKIFSQVHSAIEAIKKLC